MFHKLFIIAALTGAACGCSNLRPAPQAGGSSASDEKIQLRNNAASLLSDLLKDEQNVGKIFVVKSAGKQTTDLVKLIGATAATHERELEQLATNDPSLNLQVLNLPPGETAARDGTAKSKKHDMLFSTGANFEFNLLFTQAQAENYGWHLAKVAAENSSKPEEKQTFSKIGETMERFYGQAVEQMRVVPTR